MREQTLRSYLMACRIIRPPDKVIKGYIKVVGYGDENIEGWFPPARFIILDADFA